MKRLQTPSADSQSVQISGSKGGSATLFCAALLVLANAGCTTLFGRKGGPGDDLDLSQIKREGYTVGPNGVMQAAPSDDTSVVLEVVDSKRHFEKIPLIQGQSMFIADVVKDADLRKKLGPIHVRILHRTAMVLRSEWTWILTIPVNGSKMEPTTRYGLAIISW